MIFGLHDQGRGSQFVIPGRMSVLYMQYVGLRRSAGVGFEEKYCIDVGPLQFACRCFSSGSVQGCHRSLSG